MWRCVSQFQCAQYDKVTIKISQFANKVRESWLEETVTTLKAYSNIFFFYIFNPRTNTQIQTPTVVQGGVCEGGGGAGLIEPVARIFDML